MNKSFKVRIYPSQEQQEALAQYHSFVSGFDDGLYNYTNIYYSDDNYKMGYRLGSAHRR